MKNWNMNQDGFFLHEPLEYRPWLNYLGNGEYGLRISHLGDAFSTTLNEPRRVITNYDFYAPIKGRFLYIKDGDSLWNPSFYPSKADLATYECNHGTGYTTFTSSKSDVEAVSTHFLPRKGRFEIWKFQVRNTGRETKRLTVYPQVEYNLYETFNVDPIYYSWYTNSRLEANKRTLAFFKTTSQDVYGFFHALKEPLAYESSLSNFRASGDMQNPKGLRAPRLSSTPSAGDPYIACFQYEVELKPGETFCTTAFIGEGKSVLADIELRFPDQKAVDAEFAAVRADWKKKLHRSEFETVQEPSLRNYLQTFVPYQVFQQSLGLVRSTYRGYRDVAQDAIGMSYFDLEASRELILTLLDKQYEDGRCLRQWNTSGQFHDERDFRDLPLWLPLALDKYLENGGSPDILIEKRPYLKSEKQASLFDHMIQGMRYCLQFGPHDLMKIGIGDWNDALSGLGLEGESLWLNQCAYLALEKIGQIVAAHGHKLDLKHDLDIEALRERLYQGVIKGWTGEWFLRGYNDKGKAFGGTERLFLLPQAWFTISGMDKRDPEKAKKALDSMLAKLENENGFLKCFPAFDEYDPEVGNLSALAPGMAENYAVYNHSSAFAIYALLMAGRNEKALEYFNKLIPIYKDPSKTRAEPFVLVNFYNGGYYPEKSGQGGIPWLTGTVNWLVMILFDQIFPRKIKL